MRLAIVRQDYRPDGAVERGLERALEALLERNVAISLYTRSWPQTRLQLIEPSIIDPFHLGALWRDRGFARAACRAVRRWQPTLVESHERLLCCDVYRAADGVHAVWLEERLKRAAAAGRLAARLSPHNRYLLDVERRLYASPWLRAVICGSNMVRDEIRGQLCGSGGEAPRHLRCRGQRRLPSGTPRGARSASSSGTASTPRPPSISRWPPISRAPTSARAIDALARLPPPAHLVAIGDDPHAARYRGARAGAGRRGSRHAGRRRRRPAAVLRRGRRLRAALALRSVAGRSARSDGLRPSP